MCVCVYEKVNTTCVGGGQNRAINPLELELLVIVSHHVGPENQAWILWQSSRCS